MKIKNRMAYSGRLIHHIALVSVTALFLFSSAQSQLTNIDLRKMERERVVAAAEKYLAEPPITITASSSPRSAGGIHDFFSEGDYWWPDSAHPDGPYVQRDGQSNPDNFVAHRQALMRFSVHAPALATAYVLTGEEKYAMHAIRHFKAWFIDSLTKMNPHLKYAQAIKGKVTGRGTGIIDTIHLIEIAKAIEALEGSPSWTEDDIAAVKNWFREYLEWMTSHQYGLDEREAKNNHGACWVFQVAAFAELTGDQARMNYCRSRFKVVLLPNQLALDGSFPLELKRTKPYNYSLFNLDAFAGICQILSTTNDNLWTFVLPDGRSMKKAMEFMYPFIVDKSKWTYPRDVMYFDNWPVRHASLLFGGLALDEPRYIDLWKTLDADPTVEEVIRNYPIRQPVLWMDKKELPDVRLLDAGVLFKLRKSYLSGSRGDQNVKTLLKQADKELEESPQSVTDKEQLPPSGDKHDYMSVAPYFWPDSTKPDGLPYIRRDGERNPDREKIGDRKRIGDMVGTVQTLSLAYYISNGEKYAGHAAKLLRVWFLDEETRMNPNLKYAQAVRGVNEGRGTGIIDTYNFTELVDAIRLLSDSPSLNIEIQKGLHGWFSEYLNWLLESENGKKEAAAKNNHGTTYAVQAASIAMFLGQDSIAKEIIKRIPAERIATQIEPDGTEPLELVRTKSWGYSILNLEALIQLAQLSDNFGVNIWHFATEDGRSIKKTIDWLLPYAVGGKEWDYKQIVPMEKEKLYPALLLASQRYFSKEYEQACDRILDTKEVKSRVKLLYPRTK